MKRALCLFLAVMLLLPALGSNIGTARDSYDLALSWILDSEFGYKDIVNVENALSALEAAPTAKFYYQMKQYLSAIIGIHEAGFKLGTSADISAFNLRKLAESRGILIRLNEEREFIDELRQLALPLPDELDTYIRALIYERREEYEEAEDAYSKVLRVFDSTERLNALGWQQKDRVYASATEEYEKQNYYGAYLLFTSLGDDYISEDGYFAFEKASEALKKHKSIHTFTPATCDKPATCPECGDTQGEPLGHEYAPATCTQPRTCVRCGATEGKPLGHDAAGADCVTRAVCKRCGETVGGFGEHQWIEATCTVPKTCRICGATEGYAKVHTEVTIKGRKANCLQEGLTDGKICSVCGAVIEEQKPIPTLPHTGITIEGKAATCTEAGLTDGIICSFCGLPVKEQQTIPALGHNWQPATYERPETCSRCGLTRGEKLKPIISVGDIVTFGKYPQTASGKDNTPIEWLVLDVQDDKALLISKYGLDCQPYHKIRGENVTWETCTLRLWLNNDFLNKAFSSDEQRVVLTTTVDNSKRQGVQFQKTIGGNDTIDRVFLLSWIEAKEYFAITNEFQEFLDNMETRVTPSEYAFSQGAIKNLANSEFVASDGKPAGYWWLRSPGGNYQDEASVVLPDGSFHFAWVIYDVYTIRPALWVDLKTAGLGKRA